MSFASDVKKELLQIEKKASCCELAECYGMLRFSRLFWKDAEYHTENGLLARHFAETVSAQAGVIAEAGTVMRRSSPAFSVRLAGEAERERLLSVFGEPEEQVTPEIRMAFLQKNCCQAAFLRGAFLVCGTVSDPYKEYHLEFATPHASLASGLFALISGMEDGMQPALAARKNNMLVYLKESERIADLLTYLGAHSSAMELMQAKMFKEVRNYVNRKTNFETANISKTVSAAIRQTEAIRRVMETSGIEAFPEELRELALLRLENPEMSLREMAERLGLSRSGVNHRMQRILEIAHT